MDCIGFRERSTDTTAMEPDKRDRKDEKEKGREQSCTDLPGRVAVASGTPSESSSSSTCSKDQNSLLIGNI